jgi:iron complex outermembrane receptor protein
VANTYLNYTVRNGSRFDQTKIRLSVNNLFDWHSQTGLTQANSATGSALPAANGQPYVDPFNAAVAQISGADNVSIFSGRSIVLSVTFGLSPKR